MSVTNTTKPIVQLCIPQLFQSLPLWKNDFRFEVEAPELSFLLRQFKVVEDKSIQGLEASLFNAIGLEEGEELPMAHYRYQTHKDSSLDQALLCADPIHLEVGMNDITMTDQIADLTQDEAEEMLSALNKHFKQDGLSFIYGSNKHWYIALPEKSLIKTTPLKEVLRKNIAKFQPRYIEEKKDQKGKMSWQIIQNESQMILHSCEVNQQREIAGLPTVNSLWFWGGGEALQAQNNSNVVSVYCSENSANSAKMIANIANCDFHVLNDVFPKFKTGKTLLILDQLFSSAVHDNLDLFQQELSKLEVEIIKPLKEAWQRGEIELLIDGCDGKILWPTKPKLWQFRGRKPALLSEVSAQ